MFKVTPYITLPGSLTLPKNVLPMAGYEIKIYSGAKPADLFQLPPSRLLCSIKLDGEKNEGICREKGVPGTFFLLKDGKPVTMGSVGTSGCDMCLPYVFITKGCTISILLEERKEG